MVVGVGHVCYLLKLLMSIDDVVVVDDVVVRNCSH